MLYYLYEYLTGQGVHIPGLNLLRYISFRAGMSVLLSLWIALVYGKKIINFLRRRQMGELVRDLGLEGQKQKEGTPTMGGLIIIISTLIPVLLFTKLHNVYIVLLVVSVLWMGAIGFIDAVQDIFQGIRRVGIVYNEENTAVRFNGFKSSVHSFQFRNRL